MSSPTGVDDLERRRPVGRPCGATGAAGLEPDRRVAKTVPEGRERPDELVALRALESGLEVRSGGGHDGHVGIPGSQPAAASGPVRAGSWRVGAIVRRRTARRSP